MNDQDVDEHGRSAVENELRKTSAGRAAIVLAKNCARNAAIPDTSVYTRQRRRADERRAAKRESKK